MSNSAMESSAECAAGSTATDNDASRDDIVVLPPECWANAMEYLPFDTILSCAAVSRTMLHDAIPRLTSLRIDRSSQINLKIAARFRDIREINLNSLLSERVHDAGTDDELHLVTVDLETKIKVLPFLSKFDNLESVFFGGKDEPSGKDIEGFSPTRSYFWEGEDAYPNEGARERMLAFIDLVSGAFACGALSNQLQISGLCCPDTRESSNCQTCLRACRSFPLNSVCKFESRGSSYTRAKSGRPYGLDVCLGQATIESIVESRLGGHQFLHSEERLLHLLGGGYRYEVGGVLTIVKYKRHQFDEMKRVIKYAELDIEKLSMEKVSAAIMRSFAKGAKEVFPSASHHYLSEESISGLKNELGIDVSSTEGFGGDMTEWSKYANQVVSLLNNSLDHNNNEYIEFRDVWIDLLTLIRRFLEIETDPPIRQVVIAIPSLRKCLGISYDDKITVEAAICIKHIVLRGMHEQIQMVIDAGSIGSLCRLLGGISVRVNEVVLLALLAIVKSGTKDSIVSVLEGIDAEALATHLDSKSKVCVESSLELLVMVANTSSRDTKIAMSTVSLHSHVLRIFASTDHVTTITRCSFILRMLMEMPNRKAVVKDILKRKLLPKLMKQIKAHKDHTVQSNLTFVVVNLANCLANCKNNDTVALMKEPGFPLILAEVVKSPEACLAEKAISAVQNVVDQNPKYWTLMIQSGIPNSLVEVLGHSDRFYILRLASTTLAMCCLWWKPDSAEAKNGLKSLARLLMMDDITKSLCQALFQLLKSLSCADVVETMAFSYVRPLLRQLLIDSQLEVKLLVLKSLGIITASGHEGITSVVSQNGIACLKRMLLFQDNDIRNMSCSVISNIISGDSGNIQTAIDGDVVHYLVQMLEFEENCKQALWCIYQISKNGTETQINYLVGRDAIFHLCNIITSDSNKGIVTLLTLKNILKFGKDAQGSSNVQLFESKLEEMTDEIYLFEHETVRLEVLLKKKAWLKYEEEFKQKEYLTEASGLLNDQQLHAWTRLQYLNKSSHGEEKLLMEATQDHKLLVTDATRMKDSVIHSSERVEKYLAEAEAIAPKEEWMKLLHDDDLPLDVEGANEAMRVSSSAIETIQTNRLSKERKEDIDLLMFGLRKLFKRSKGSAKRKKKSKKAKKKKRKVQSDYVKPNSTRAPDASIVFAVAECMGEQQLLPVDNRVVNEAAESTCRQEASEERRALQNTTAGRSGHGGVETEGMPGKKEESDVCAAEVEQNCKKSHANGKEEDKHSYLTGVVMIKDQDYISAITSK